MSIKIGHASIDENGNIAGGNAGDQTGKEICIRQWYDKPWNVYLECLDESLAYRAANIMEIICNQNTFGYDQNERLSGYNSIVKEGMLNAKGEFDCSSLVSACYKLAGLDIPVSCTTRNLRSVLLATGKFKAYTDKSHLKSDRLAKRASIFLSEGHHVVMALEDGDGTMENPYPAPKSVVKIGDKGTDVKWVQFELGIRVDGIFGVKTDAAVKSFQNSKDLEVDGIVGNKTLIALLK